MFGDEVEFNVDPTQSKSFSRQFTANHLTDRPLVTNKTVQENTQIQLKKNKTAKQN